MSSYTEIPVQTPHPHPQTTTTPTPTPTTRLTTRPRIKHPGTRYYVHRVKESLTTRVSKFLCSCFLGLLFIVGLIAFILWLSLRPHRPRVHVNSFTVTGIAPDNGIQNSIISFNVSIRNPNQNVDIYYDEVDGTVYFREVKIVTVVLLYPFYQPNKNTTFANGTLSLASLSVTDSWPQIMANGTVDFRLELISAIRFKVASWMTRKHRMHADCAVLVGSDGQISPTSKNKRCSLYFY
ncbi:protein NDR1-like [Magnolia sinica]|uniref:protein NDR1-like n=1 Tax=Magnolia sinica TaxID=86752 RepID=UPI002658269D|nr:protein NDR1-like [Magnolia sinica]